jgi:4-amino-4-deoxychorismate lyase
VSPALLFNGGPAPDLSGHRALHYGDGVFRTCFIYKSQVLDLDEQCDLVTADAARLALAPVAVAQLAAEARRLAAGVDQGVLKILLLRGGEARGYGASGGTTDRLLRRYDAPSYRAACWEQGVGVCRSPIALASQPALAGIKHLNRLEQVLASRDWPPDADEALLADAAGRPICGTRTNLFRVGGGVLYTAPLDQCGVAGHLRRKVLALAPALGVEVRVQHGPWEELEAADEVFLTNSLVGIWPVARLDARRWVAPGPVTRRFMERLAHPRWLPAGRAA